MQCPDHKDELDGRLFYQYSCVYELGIERIVRYSRKLLKYFKSLNQIIITHHMTPHNHLVVLNYILNECSLTAYDSQLEKVS